MCLYTSKGISIATEDIPVFKVLCDNHTSPIRGYFYTPETHSIPKIESINGVVREGFHSFLNRSRAENFAQTYHKYKVFEAIIPAGSEYIIGDSGDIVSNTLRFTKL